MDNRVKLDDLEANSQSVRQSVASTNQAFQFENGATKLKKKYQWEQYRTILMVGGLGIVLSSYTDFPHRLMVSALNVLYYYARIQKALWFISPPFYCLSGSF